MTSCLAIPSQMPPIRTSKKRPLESQNNYFDCVDAEIAKKQESQANKDSN
jgi:hypothetical protein